MKNKKFILTQYSALSACFLALNSSSRGQAVYTDIDPDFVLDNNWETAGVDMNNDGIVDFGFLNRSFDFSTYYSYYSSHLNALYGGPQSPNNEIAALTHVITPFYGGFTVYFPFALNESETIDESLIFHNDGYQRIAYRYIQTDGDYFPKGGIWYPEVLDHYLGVRFYDSLDCLHYGWIRCDVFDNGRKLIVKDYAFENKCDTGIMAGDTIGDTSNVEISELNLIAPTIYSYSGIICINIDKQLLGANFSVVSFEGKVISSGCLNELNNKFNSAVGNGTYIVAINKNSYSYSKQIILVQ